MPSLWAGFTAACSLLRSAIAHLRGAQSSFGHFDRTPPPMDLVMMESHLID